MRRKSLGLRLIILLLFSFLTKQSAFSGTDRWTLSGLQGGVSAFAVDPSNPSTLYAALSIGGTFKSADSGRNWARIEGLDNVGGVSALAVDPMNPNSVMAAGASYLFTSRDSGQTWNRIDQWFQLGPFRSIQFDPINPSNIYVVAQSGILKSSDGGTTWTEIGHTIAQCGGWGFDCAFRVFAIDPQNPNILYAGGGSYGVWKSTSGGGTWTAQYRGSSTLSITSLAVDPKDPRILFAGANTGILKSSDGGNTWAWVLENNAGYGRTLAIDPIHPATVYAGGMIGVSRSIDGGRSWNEISAGLTFGYVVLALVLNPRNPAMLYASTDHGVYRYGEQGSTLYFPRLVSRNTSATTSDDSEYTGIGIVNRDSVDATLTFTAYDREGHLVSGVGITNPAVRTLKAGAQMAITDAEVWGSGLPALKPDGWFRVDSMVTEVAGFFLMYNAGLSILDGAEAPADLLEQPSALTEIQTEGFTQIHIANPNAVTATVRLELIDPSGAVLSKADRSINPAGALIEDLTTLFPGLTFSANQYVKIWCPDFFSRPVVFAYMGKSERFIQALNGQGLFSGASTLYCPQYVVGGSEWSTALSIVNPETFAATATLRFFRDDGTQIGALRTVTIPPFGKAYINDQNFFLDTGGSQIQGYVEISSGQGNRLAGSVTFGDLTRSVFGSALPLIHALQNDFIFAQVACNATWFTGIAIVNPNDSAASATVDLLDKSGSVMRTKKLVVPARSRISKLLTQQEFFPEIVGVDVSSGYIHVVVDRGVAAFAVFGPNDLSALAAVLPQSIR